MKITLLLCGADPGGIVLRLVGVTICPVLLCKDKWGPPPASKAIPPPSLKPDRFHIHTLWIPPRNYLSSTNLTTREKKVSRHQRRAHHRQNDPSKEMGEEFMNFEKRRSFLAIIINLREERKMLIEQQLLQLVAHLNQFLFNHTAS